MKCKHCGETIIFDGGHYYHDDGHGQCNLFAEPTVKKVLTVDQEACEDCMHYDKLPNEHPCNDCHTGYTHPDLVGQHFVRKTDADFCQDQSAGDDNWICKCNYVNTGGICTHCGEPKLDSAGDGWELLSSEDRIKAGDQIKVGDEWSTVFIGNGRVDSAIVRRRTAEQREPNINGHKLCELCGMMNGHEGYCPRVTLKSEPEQQGGKVAWAIPYEYGEGPEIAITQLQEHSDEQDRRIDAVCVRMYARYCRLTDLVQGLLNREGNG